jgi:serine/threonine protein kinase, bacterial
MPLVRGATAAGLQIVRLLGSGHIGELYLAEHPRLPRHLALKVLPDDLSADLEYRHRFTLESNLAAALWHPHIVGIYDRGEFEGRLWLSMDYVEGVDAARLLSDSYPDGMPPDMVVEIVAAVADALDYAHDQGLLHRYVNPTNILLASSPSDQRRILLAGFGIARRPDDVNSVTRADMAIGTASYTAPEQLKNEEIDGRADQYALACTAFHLLTGSPPFAHFNPAVLASKHLNESPPRPGDVRPELARFGGTFARALAKEPTDRFRRCQDFARALERGDSKSFSFAGGGAHAAPAASERNGAPPTPPAVPAAADVEVDGGDDVIAPPDVLADTTAHDATAPPEDVESGPAAEDAQTTSRRRRLVHTAALVLPIAVVAVAGIVIVMYLRSAAEPQDTPTNVEPTSSATPIAPAPRPPARATPPPAVTAPPPPTVRPPATTPTATTSPSPPETTAPPTTKPPTTKAQTTKSPTPTSSTTPPAGPDTRPAVGMPCGPDQTGATTVGNTGGPVSCVQTPGGFAWEPPGG